MWHRLRGQVSGLLLLLGVCGCAVWQQPAGGRLATAPPAIDTVGLDIIIARVPLGDEVANGSLWNEIDEQPLPTELRRLLAYNGLRAGVIGTRLPVPLEQLLKLTETPPSGDQANHVVDFENEPALRHRLVRVVAGRRTNIICTGENSRHAELPVLVREADGALRGKTYRQVMGLLTAHAMLEGGGRVRLELVPEIEHGEPQRRFEPGEGMMKIEFGPPHEKYEFLRMSAVLAPGQMLLVTGMPDRPGSLGYQFFMEPGAQKPQQKLLLVRLAQTQYDDLFSSDSLLDSPAKPDAEQP
jgi:hypothetical protein